jgi:hypothetical protein
MCESGSEKDPFQRRKQNPEPEHRHQLLLAQEVKTTRNNQVFTSSPLVVLLLA